jgi:hypothetical protein
VKVASLALRFLLELAALGAGATALGIAFAFVAVADGIVVRRLGEAPALDSAG